VSLDFFALFSFISKEALSVAASIVVFFNQFVRLLFEGGFYSRKYGTSFFPCSFLLFK